MPTWDAVWDPTHDHGPTLWGEKRHLTGTVSIESPSPGPESLEALAPAPDVKAVARQALDLGELLWAVLHLQADAILGLQHLHIDFLHRLAAHVQTAILPRDRELGSKGRGQSSLGTHEGADCGIRCRFNIP